MLKFGTRTIALPLAIKKCTVQTGCTVYIYTRTPTRLYYPARLRARVMIELSFENFTCTVESPNKGHFGTNINSSGLSTI